MKVTFLSSRLAKKIFFFFILSSMVPLILTAMMTYVRVDSLIESNVHGQLRNIAKENALLLYARLKLAKGALKMALETPGALENNTASSQLLPYFSALATIGPGRPRRQHWGRIDQDILDRAQSRSGTGVWLGSGPNGREVFLALASGAVAKLRPDYLWDADSSPMDTQLCVLSAESHPLHCGGRVDIDQLNAVMKNSPAAADRFFQWKLEGREMLSVYWVLFMKHEFQADNWIFVASRQKADEFEKISGFRTTFISILLLAILLVVFLASVLIRRNLDVVTQLIRGTRNIIQGNYDSRIDVHSDDEFSELAQSFNVMSESLEKAMLDYDASSAIDKSILESDGAEKIVETIFNGLHVIAPFKSQALISVTDNDTTLHRIYYRNAPHAWIRSSNDLRAGGAELHTLAEEGLRTVPIRASLLDGLFRLWAPDGNRIYIIPVKQRDRLLAIMLATVETASRLDASIESRLFNFSKRTAVALQALQREAALRYQARYDPLTDIPNRGTLVSVCDRIRRRLPGQIRCAAFLFMDLDRFKNVNDSFGHVIGDQLLIAAADRMKTLAKDNESIARLGGDEFAIIVESDTTRALLARTEALCRQLIARIAEPFTIANHSMHVGVSIGIALMPEQGETFADALRCSDIAMYMSKTRGGNRFTFYEASMSDIRIRRTVLERNLRAGVGDRDISVFYQPKVDARNYAISGFEALFRWRDPVYGNVSPLEVITLAEEIGLIVELGKLVFELAVEQWQRWKQQGYRPGSLAVNVSPLQLISADFVDFIDATLREYPLVEAGDLQLEITENIMLHDKEKALVVLSQIRARGLKVAIDDFGTGYSSLSYLMDIPADILKIDRAFVLKIGQDSKPAALLGSVIELGKNIGYEIVAEGVETERQAEYLRDCGVEQLQGYLFGKAVPPEAVEAGFLAKRMITSL